MTLALERSRNMHMRYPPIDGLWTWDIKRDRVYGDANLSAYFGLTSDEFSRGAPLERWMQSIEREDRSRIRLAIRKAIEQRSSFREVYKIRSEKIGLRTILAVGQCCVDDLGKAALYPGWFVDLTQEAASEDDSLREIHGHVEQAREIAQSIGHDMLSYLLDNIQEEVQLKLGNGSRRRKSS
ncbi:PAS domain-containing protein [Mesorhizobium sp. B1-1-8]|uniref:PAS domain-containing protein n=1 Tax=Mesorhizobium sp. B1-1-8 TaxID=2589976 RepID=UPI0011293858|nr:PAS domain-containing protein [Mesorhizobium sp. B1-1-8]UCI06236.1 PAS domain-containing protein [Mesorhizobium sp. B1-1-8]